LGSKGLGVRPYGGEEGLELQVKDEGLAIQPNESPDHFGFSVPVRESLNDKGLLKSYSCRNKIMKRFYGTLFGLLGGLLLAGCERIEHGLVGKWISVSEFRDTEFFDAIGWEIEFRPNGKFRLLSDGGMSIQRWKKGGFHILGNQLSIDYFANGEPLVFEYTIGSDGLDLHLSSEMGEMQLIRSNEPHQELRALPRMPETLGEATSLLISEMSVKDKRFIATRKQDDLISFHFGWGMGIRNRFGLWTGNEKLLASCGSRWMHPDEASSVIIESVWRELRDGLDADLRAALDEVHSVCDAVEFGSDALEGINFAVLAEKVNMEIRKTYPEKTARERVVFEVTGGEEWMTRPLGLNLREGETLSLCRILAPLSFRHFANIEYEPGKIILAGPEREEEQ